jgi:hypothetical protein
MSTGQARVVVLLVSLLFLETVAHPTVKQWFKNAYSAIGQGVQPKQ